MGLSVKAFAGQTLKLLCISLYDHVCLYLTKLYIMTQYLNYASNTVVFSPPWILSMVKKIHRTFFSPSMLSDMEGLGKGFRGLCLDCKCVSLCNSSPINWFRFL